MTDETYTASVTDALNDTSVKNYFISNNKKPLDFIKLYIEVDKVLTTCPNMSSNTVYDKLEDIKDAIKLYTNHISQSQSSIVSLFQSKLDQLSNNIKDITNNDIRNMFLEFQKQVSSNQDLNNLRIVLDNFRDKIDNINSQTLNEFDRKTLEMLTNMQTNLLSSLETHSISHKINSIENNLLNLNEHFSNNSSKKGQLAENVLVNVLSEHFPDTEVINTSSQPNSGDIHLIKDNKPKILIDSKHFASKTVPKRDLDKFYADIQQNNCCGILCNAFGGIANKQHFEIDIVDKNVLVFVHSHKFDPHVFKIAIDIIYNVHEQLKDKQHDNIVVDQRFYQNMKIEYNYFLQSLHHHLDIIKTNVNALSQLSFNLLDNFFKRKITSINSDYSCHLCTGNFKTLKILKTHLKKIHGHDSD